VPVLAWMCRNKHSNTRMHMLACTHAQCPAVATYIKSPVQQNRYAVFAQRHSIAYPFVLLTVCGPVGCAAGIDDDKSGCLQAIHAVEAYLTVGSALPINVK